MCIRTDEGAEMLGLGLGLGLGFGLGLRPKECQVMIGVRVRVNVYTDYTSVMLKGGIDLSSASTWCGAAGGWACGVCSKPGTKDRYRCVSGCDFDACKTCFMKGALVIAEATPPGSPMSKRDRVMRR